MRITITLDDALYEAIAEQAQREDRPITRVIRAVLARECLPHPSKLRMFNGQSAVFEWKRQEESE